MNVAIVALVISASFLLVIVFIFIWLCNRPREIAKRVAWRRERLLDESVRKEVGPVEGRPIIGELLL